LFYIAGGSVMAAAEGPGGSLGPPRALFDRADYNFFWHSYDPAPDGKRLLMVRRDAASVPRQLNVILNWNEELQRLLPAGGRRLSGPLARFEGGGPRPAPGSP